MAKIPINIKEGKIKTSSGVIVGIDLGTTNSLVAYLKDDKVVVVKDNDGQNTLVPSMLHFDNHGQIIVGNAAKVKLETDPERTIFSVKRLMGRSYNDIKEMNQILGYQILDNDDDKLVKVEIDGKYFTPIELSAEILKELKTRVEAALNESVDRAVITVPAYFNDTQRQATRDAGKLAGLDVLRVVNEPTAASLAYGLAQESQTKQLIAVYDLGGGTFDISILMIEDGVFEVLSTNGDTFLGGDDFDKAIFDHWSTAFSEGQLKDKSFVQSLRLKAEWAKKKLSTENEIEAELGGQVLKMDRTGFEQLIATLVERTLNACQQAIKDAEINILDIDHVVMVGGSTRVPLVKNEVSKFFEKEVNDSLDPDEVVAIGAAIQADILAGNRNDMLLLDITPLSLGIETVGGLMDTIIPRNSKVPTRVGRKYTTSVDGQKNLKVAVYQGERDLVEHNRKLGEFILSDIPPMPAGIPQIEIQFLIDADGILIVRAKELRSNTETRIQIKSQYGIPEEEMAKMLLDSIQNAKGDMDIRSFLEVKNEVDNVSLASKKFVDQNSDWLTQEQVEKIIALEQTMAGSLDSKDVDLIRSKMEALNHYTAPLAHEALDRRIGENLKGTKL